MALIESLPAAPESKVAPVLATDGVILLLCCVPVVEESMGGAAGVPSVTGLWPELNDPGCSSSDPGTEVSCLVVSG